MAREESKVIPNYKRIFMDIITYSYPKKSDLFAVLQKKKELSTLDVLKFNKMIFGDDNNGLFKSYDTANIHKILDFQKKENFNNSMVAKHFSISRNTLARWKKLYA